MINDFLYSITKDTQKGDLPSSVQKEKKEILAQLAAKKDEEFWDYAQNRYKLYCVAEYEAQGIGDPYTQAEKDAKEFIEKNKNVLPQSPLIEYYRELYDKEKKEKGYDLDIENSFGRNE